VIRGVAVSSGICRGRIVVLRPSRPTVERVSIDPNAVERELARLQHALIQTRQQLVEVQERVEQAMGSEEAGIFDAHLMVLEDPVLLEEVTKLVRKEHINVEAAFAEVSARYIKSIESVGDDYLRERAADMRDVSHRVLGNLTGMGSGHELPSLREPSIIVAHDLTPSQTAQLDRKLVLGFATDVGSKTSHTAILARSLGLPAVVGLQGGSANLQTGLYALLDAYNGVLIINPTDQTLFEYGQIVRRQSDLAEKLRDLRDKPAVSFDGVNVTLSANVEGSDDIEAVQQAGAEGVGLFRTEYLYLNRPDLPSEEDQFQEYKKVAEALNPAPVIIRTLDIGGDKFVAQAELPQELNPFLGWRAIRYCLEEKSVFRTQIRAILRASVFGNVKMMYPMISGLPELIEANAFVEECKAGLRAEGIPFNDAMDIGMMIEIPSAALVADALAKRVKFFSIGTNDLVQYSLAVDRLNERIAHLYEPTHPGVLRLIKMTVDAAHAQGIWVGVCGEMAGDPVMAPLLIGLGVDELSAAAPLVPATKFMIRRLRVSEARELADFALKAELGSEVLERAQKLAHSIAPALFES
jgi:phosphotransferase system enzyme I (PtsI)